MGTKSLILFFFLMGAVLGADRFVLMIGFLAIIFCYLKSE